MASTAPPLPGDEAEIARRAEARRRLIILEGNMRPLAMDQAKRRFSGSQIHEMGEPVTSRNLLRYLAKELSALYWSAPLVSCEGDPDEDGVAATVASPDVGWWELAKRNQRRAFAVRESVVAVGMVQRGDRFVPNVRMVSPAYVFAIPSPDEPRQPSLIVEARMRVVTWDNSTKARWCWDVLDIRDPEAPVYMVVVAAEGSVDKALDPGELAKRDVTAQVLGTDGPMVGADYPFRWGDQNTPYIPYRIYHTEETGQLWDPWCGSEAVEGTLDIAVLWTMWQHLVLRASWDQRVIIDGEVAGASAVGDPGLQRRAIDMSPTRILMIASNPASPGAAKIGSWGPAGDPYAMAGSIVDYEASTALQLGVSSGDIVKTAQPKSGLSIQLTREGVRESQREQEPQFLASDRVVLAMCAAQMRRHPDAPRADIPAECEHPESWAIEYPGLPLSPSERAAKADELAALEAAGVVPSEVWKVQQIMRVSPDRARAMIEQWQADKREEQMRSLGAGIPPR